MRDRIEREFLEVFASEFDEFFENVVGNGNDMATAGGGLNDVQHFANASGWKITKTKTQRHKSIRSGAVSAVRGPHWITVAEFVALPGDTAVFCHCLRIAVLLGVLATYEFLATTMIKRDLGSARSDSVGPNAEHVHRQRGMRTV